jgi:hypothetical protein
MLHNPVVASAGGTLEKLTVFRALSNDDDPKDGFNDCLSGSELGSLRGGGVGICGCNGAEDLALAINWIALSRFLWVVV